MAEINWQRPELENRTDKAADNISEFLDAILATIDEDAARASEAQWETVCRYFAGCSLAARQQRGTPREGGRRIAEYLMTAFPCASDGSRDGFEEFMDWLSYPAQFRPTALRVAIERSCG